MNYNVAIIGGGPAGSTVGALLKRLQPELKVAIFEGAKFPRDHVGESLLPATCEVLEEIDAWNKVEEAGFPVKLGGIYRWGQTDEAYPLAFLRGEEYEDPARPAKYEGQRARTTFQVDRSIFDKILLDNAASHGCEVFEEAMVKTVHFTGDRIDGLTVTGLQAEESFIQADHYVDASGGRGILRKALGVQVDAPTALRNIAIYDYWQDADWGQRAGVDGTYIHVMSIDWGWIWFISMGKTRTSVGLVTSAEYYKKSGLTTEELYLKAIECEPLISKLLKPARRENILKAESDWSYVADRLVGENWILSGDSAGFADPILSAGVTLTMTGARKVAYTLSELYRGELDAAWVKSEYERIQRSNIRDHIRFADYWYSANAKFTDLTEYCSEIAREAGISLVPDEAFRWLAVGGFSSDAGGYMSPTAATFQLSTVKNMVAQFGGSAPEWLLQRYKTLKLNVENATRDVAAAYLDGRVERLEVFRRGDKRLFLQGFFKRAYVVLLLEQNTDKVIEKIYKHFRPRLTISDPLLLTYIVEVLEAMLHDGWIDGVDENGMVVNQAQS